MSKKPFDKIGRCGVTITPCEEAKSAGEPAFRIEMDSCGADATFPVEVIHDLIWLLDAYRKYLPEYELLGKDPRDPLRRRAREDNEGFDVPF